MTSIFHVITTICRGGAENQLLILAKEQINQGYDVHVVYLKDSPELLDDFRNMGVQVHSDLIGCNPLLQPLKLSQILGIKNSIVHAHLPRAELISFLVPISIKLFVTRHNSEPFFPKAPKSISRFLSRIVSLRACKIIALSNAVAHFLKEEKELVNFNKLKVVHYGYIPVFSSEYRKNHIRNSVHRIGTIARLTEQKDLPTMIKAFNLIRKEFGGLTLSIVGAGPLENYLRTLVIDLKLEDDIRFLGRTDKILDFLLSLDVFVLTSEYEGFGLVLLEAMDAGVPIVASRNSAIPEVLGTEFPGLCETGNYLEFSEKILALKDHTYRNKVLEIQSERLSLFHANKMSDMTRSIYFG